MPYKEECIPGYPHVPHPKQRDAPNACPIHKWQDHGGWCYVCDLAFEDPKCPADHTPEQEREALSQARKNYQSWKRLTARDSRWH